jgi:N-acetylmuramoyl-L-alanine amidase
MSLLWASACVSVRPGSPLARRGDEIVVCGQLFHTGAPVVLWTDPGGYDAYRVERRFAPPEEAGWEASAKSLPSPNRYGARSPSPPDAERVRDRGWDLAALQSTVDQFVIHYDAAGTSRQCFRILHDVRGLSIHFMIDLDGTIYQTLDLKERAWHATRSNDRSVGVELANIGAFPAAQASLLDRWYTRDERGVRVTIPPEQGDGGQRDLRAVLRPARGGPVQGEIHGVTLVQQDFTPQQYESLEHLAATLCTVLPLIRCDCPRDESGRPLARSLTDAEWNGYRGLLGHCHVQENKRDPGPAFQWDPFVSRARRLMGSSGRE